MRTLALLWSTAIAEAILLGLYAVVIEPARLAFSVVRVPHAGIDRPRRFLLLSDTHLHPWSFRTYEHVARAAAWARAAGATHAILAGDLLESDLEVEAVAARLRHSLGDLPAVYVSGNHEVHGELWWQRHRNDPDRIAAAMAAHGIERIDGQLVELDGIPVVGIGWRGRRIGAGAKAHALLDQARGRAIVVAHSPDHVRGLPRDRVLIALAGHTHGAQVRLPFVPPRWIPVRAPIPRPAGRMSLDGVPAYVSRGIGATVPIRLGAVPEATLVVISPSPSPADAATAGEAGPQGAKDLR